MRTDISYYGFVQDDYGDSVKQACWNQAIYVYGQAVIGHLYYDDLDTIYYTTLAGSDQSYNGTYLRVIGEAWNTGSTYIEVMGQTPPTTTTQAPTTSTTTDPSVTTTTGAPTTSTTTTPVGYGLYLYKQTNTIGGRLARIEIWQKDYAGASAEIDALSGSPILLSSGNVGNDIYQPIVKSSLTLSIIDTEQIDYSIFFTPDATKFKFIYKLDGTTEWTGYLTPDSFIQSMSYRSTITLIARDNLGYLDQLDFDMSGAEAVIGDILEAGLVKIGFGFTTNYNTVKIGDGGINALDAIVNISPFRDGTWHEAMSNLIKGIGCQLRYMGANQYVLTDIGELYNLSGEATESDFLFIDKSGVLEIQPAWRKYNIVQDYGVNGDIYDGNLAESEYSFEQTVSVPRPGETNINLNLYTADSPYWGIGGLKLAKPTEWGEHPDTILITGDTYALETIRPALAYQQALPNMTQKIEIKFSVSNTVKMPDLTWTNSVPYLQNFLYALNSYTIRIRCNIFFVTATTTYVLRESWEEYTGEVEYIQFDIPSGGYSVTSGGGYARLGFFGFKDVELTIDMTPFEANGTFRVCFYPWEINEAVKNSISTNYLVAIKNLSINVDISDTAQSLEKSVVIDSKYNMIGNIDLPMGQVPFYQGNALTYYNGIFKNDAYRTPLTNWQRGSTGSYFNLYDLVGYEISQHFNTPKRKLTGDIIIDENRSIMPSFGFYYTDETKDYLLNAGTLDVLSEVMNVELIEVTDFVDPLITTTTTSAPVTSTTTGVVTTSTTVPVTTTTTNNGTTTSTTQGITTTSTTSSEGTTTSTTSEPTTTTTTEAVLATVVTNDAVDVTSSTAGISGEVTAEGTAAVTESGMCWSLTTNPTTADNKVVLSSGIGTFGTSLLNLSPSTIHYYKAYAISTAGTAYGIQKSFETLTAPTTTTTTEGITTTSTTAPVTTTTTGVPERTPEHFRGGGTSKAAAYADGESTSFVILGYIYLDVDGYYYGTATGGSPTDNGYYFLHEVGSGAEDSLYLGNGLT